MQSATRSGRKGERERETIYSLSTHHCVTLLNDFLWKIFQTFARDYKSSALLNFHTLSKLQVHVNYDVEINVRARPERT